MLIVGFTGTREGPTPAQHAGMGRFLLHMFARIGATHFVHGGARGCDTLAHNIVTAHGLTRHIRVDIYPSRDAGSVVWIRIPSPNVVVHSVAPPLDRNRKIVACIHGLLAVPRSAFEELRSGTWATVRYAREIGCPVYIVQPDGRIIQDRDPLFEGI